MSLTRLSAVLVLAVVAVAGCAPGTNGAAPSPSASARPTVSATASETATPRPTPTSTESALTKPAVSDLVLTPDGLGPLVLGAAPPASDPTLGILVFDPAHCDGVFGDPGLWVANYPGDPAFTVVVSDDNQIVRIDTSMGPIPTDTGITIGSPLSAVLAAYPAGFDNVITTGPISDVYVIDGVHGRLLIEVVKRDDSRYEVDTVVILRAIALDGGPGSPIISTDNVGGGCPSGA